METDYIDLTESVVRDQEIEFESNLIEAIKNEKCLYAKDHISYENKIQKELAWNKVSNFIGKPTTDCMNKWYSLLQTFLHLYNLESKGYRSMEAVKWPHYAALKVLRPQMVEKYVDLVLSIQVDSKCRTNAFKAQKSALITEMENNRNELMSVYISNALRQEIWTDIASKLNAIGSGTALPVIHWQKIWWDIKQMIAFRKKLELKGINVNSVGTTPDEDLRVLKICGIKPTDRNQSIIGLESYIEFDVNTDQARCKNCAALKSASRMCVNCSPQESLPCDVCLNVTSSTKCDITCWSPVAKRMIPIECRHNSTLAMCNVCHTNLKWNASTMWKTCRFCAKAKQNLQNFLSPSLQLIREAFCSATNITISMTDGLPCSVCTNCLDQLRGFQQFYLEFCNAQIMLQKIHETRFIDNDLMKELPLKSISKPSNKRSKSCRDEPTTAVENSEGRPLDQVLVTYSEEPVVCEGGDTVPKESNPPTSKCNALNTHEKLIKSIKTIQNEIAASMRSSPPASVNEPATWPTFSPNQNSSKPAYKSSSNAKILTANSKSSKVLSENKSSTKSVGKVILINKDGSADSIPRVYGDISISRLPKKAVPTSAETTPKACESLDVDSKTQAEVSLPCSSSQILISHVFSLNQGHPTLSQGGTLESIDYQSRELPIVSQASLSDHRNQNTSFTPANATRDYITQINTPAMNAKSIGAPYVSTPIVESQVQQTRPSIPTIMQRAFEPAENISHQNKSKLNPLLQSLLNKPALDPIPTFNPVRIHNYMLTQAKPAPLPSNKAPGVRKSSKLVPLKSGINSFTPLSLNASCKSPTIKSASKKPPERRKTIHELSHSKRTTCGRKTSLEAEVIVIRDDTPPRDVRLSSGSTSISLFQLNSDSIDNEDEHTPLASNAMITEPVLEHIINLAEEESVDINVNDKNIKYLSSSALIDYAIDKAYSNHSMASPRRRNVTVLLKDFQSKKPKNSPPIKMNDIIPENDVKNKTGDHSTPPNSYEEEIGTKRALRKRTKQNGDAEAQPKRFQRMSLRSGKPKS